MKFIKYMGIAIAAILVVILAILVLILSAIFPSKKELRKEMNHAVTHTYPLSETRSLVINNWNCGATCTFSTSVILDEKKGSKVTHKTLLSCEGVSDIELSAVTVSSAQIATMDGDQSQCDYKVGGTISF